jgi:hypothetical protein
VFFFADDPNPAELEFKPSSEQGLTIETSTLVVRRNVDQYQTEFIPSHEELGGRGGTMHRRYFLRVIGGLTAVCLAALGFRRSKEARMDANSPFDRVVFVCCDDHGDYSPGVYLHGPDGGGPACLSLAAEAAHCMRAGEVSDSAAGLCGYLFTQLGAGVTSGGGLSLWDAPNAAASKTIDWQAYCAWNVDLILINVDRRSAECFVSPQDPNSPNKLLVGRLEDLKFGG